MRVEFVKLMFPGKPRLQVIRVVHLEICSLNIEQFHYSPGNLRGYLKIQDKTFIQPTSKRNPFLTLFLTYYF